MEKVLLRDISTLMSSYNKVIIDNAGSEWAFSIYLHCSPGRELVGAVAFRYGLTDSVYAALWEFLLNGTG